MLLARGALELILLKKMQKHKTHIWTHMFLIIASRLYAMAYQSCSGSTIIVHRHYKNDAYAMTRHARCIQTMENVAYDYFVEMLKNKNALRMLTRDTIVHTPNSAGSTYHSSGEHAEPIC